MKEWNLRSAKAVANPIAFVLEQSAKDVKEEIPTATPTTIAKWQAEALSLSGIADTEKGVRSIERQRAINLVWGVYGGQSADTVQGFRCHQLMESIAGDMPRKETKEHTDLGDPATIPYPFLTRAWARLKGK
jgi:hypothetical protein